MRTFVVLTILLVQYLWYEDSYLILSHFSAFNYYYDFYFLPYDVRDVTLNLHYIMREFCIRSGTMYLH